MHKQLRRCVVGSLVYLSASAAFAATSADSLLAVDQNRTEIVTSLVEKWKGHLNAGKADTLRKTLMGLRADKLLAVSLAQDQKQFAALLEKDDFLPVKGVSDVARAKTLGDESVDVVYTPVTPCRLFYTEIASGGAGGALLPGVTRTFDTRGSLTGQGGAAGCSVPNTATAIVLQMGAFSSFGLGWINAGPQGSPIPSGVLMAYNNVAFINATSVVLKLNTTNGQFWAFSNNNQTELYGDVLGYFAAPPQPIGDVTQVTAGTGLTGGGTAGALTLGIAAGGVSSTELAANAVTTPKIATGAVTRDKLSGTGCSAGQILSFDGAAWQCAVPPGTSVSRLKPQHGATFHNAGGNNAGRFSSIAIGVDGLPLIAYYDQANGDLKMAHCNDIECSSATYSTIDSTGNVGQYPSLAIGLSGNGVVSYYDVTNTALKIAFCADIACTSATVQTADTTNDVGRYSSLVISENVPTIAYYDATVRDLKLLRCNSSSACASPTVVTVVGTGDVGEWSALTVSGPSSSGGAEYGIAYYDATAHQLRLARCGSFGSISNCAATPTLVTVAALGANIAEGIAITTMPNGAAAISYGDRVAGGAGTWRVAVCNDIACTAPTITSAGMAIVAGQSAQYSAISLGADGLPLMVFGSGHAAACDANGGGTTGGARKCRSADCSSIAFRFPGSLQESPSLTHGVDGMPIFSAWQCSNSAATTSLKTVHCSSSDCSQGYRPR